MAKKRMDPKKVVSAIKALQAAMRDVDNFRGLPAWQYDDRVRAALEIAKAQIKLIEAEMIEGPTPANDAELRALLEVMKLKITETEGWLGPVAH
jgi:hypothetical protein